MEHILSNALIFSKILFYLKHSSNSCFVLVSLKLESKICVSMSAISYFLIPGTNFVEDKFSTDIGGGVGLGGVCWFLNDSSLVGLTLL